MRIQKAYNNGLKITQYDITLCVPELGTDILLRDVDTGVLSQPQNEEAHEKDFRNDFTHARRCIAGAFASSDKLIQHLQEHDTPEYAKLKPIEMRLMTNNFDRGVFQVQPSDNESVNVNVLIGIGDNLVPNSLPKDIWKQTWEGIDVSGATAQTERALNVVDYIGGTLLQALSEQASH